MSIGHIMAEAWEHETRTSEDPFNRPIRATPFAEMFGYRPFTYREELDRVKINSLGEPIPRITLVKKNLCQLGNIRMDPARLR